MKKRKKRGNYINWREKAKEDLKMRQDHNDHKFDEDYPDELV